MGAAPYPQTTLLPKTARSLLVRGNFPSLTSEILGLGLCSLPSHQVCGTPALPWDLTYDPGIISLSPRACSSTQTQVHRGCKYTVHSAALSRQSCPAGLKLIESRSPGTTQDLEIPSGLGLNQGPRWCLLCDFWKMKERLCLSFHSFGDWR